MPSTATSSTARSHAWIWSVRFTLESLPHIASLMPQSGAIVLSRACLEMEQVVEGVQGLFDRVTPVLRRWLREDAHHRRVELERLGVGTSKVCGTEQFLYLLCRVGRRLARGPRTAWLRGDRDGALRPQPRANARRQTAGSRQKPTEFTARILSTGPPRSGSSSAVPRRRSTRPVRTAAAFRFDAARTMTAEWSTPKTRPPDASRFSSAIATPGPKPTSRTRSVGCTSNKETTQRFRCTFEDRCAMTQPATRPPAPCGCVNWPTTRRRMRCCTLTVRLNNMKCA